RVCSVLCISRRPAIPPLFPYTTLFRSRHPPPPAAGGGFRAADGGAVRDRHARPEPRRTFGVQPEHRGRGLLQPHGHGLSRHRKRSEEHTSELQSPDHLVCRLLLEKKK